MPKPSIKDYFSEIVFHPANHMYLVNGKRYKNVTAIKKEIMPAVDFEAKKVEVAQRQNKTVDTVSQEWRTSAELGTRLHKDIEDYFQGVVADDHPVSLANQTPEFAAFVEWWSKANFGSGVYANESDSLDVRQGVELQVYDKEMELAGTVDRLIYNKETGKYALFDWKRVKWDLDKVWDQDATLSEPFQDWPAHQLTEFSLQLSMYKLILERNVPGLEIGEMWIVRFFGTLPAQAHRAFDLSDLCMQYLNGNEGTEMPETTQATDTADTIEQNLDEHRYYYITDNYSRFKFYSHNRVTDSKFLARLEASVRACDLLTYQPILVNRDYEIIDGQHRFVVAQKLGLAFSYVIGDGLGLPEIIKLNASREGWKLQDYLRAYIGCGNKEYAKIERFLKEFPFLNLSESLRLFAKDYSGSGLISTKFKDGDLTISDQQIKNACTIAGILSDYLVALKPNKAIARAPKRKDFMFAIKHIYKLSSYEHDRCISKLSENPFLIDPATKGVWVWVKAIEDVQNHHRTAENRQSFDL